MAELRKIRTVNETENDFNNGGSAGLRCITSDTHDWLYFSQDGSRVYKVARQSYFAGSSTTYVDNDFNDVTVRGDHYITEYIRHFGDSNTFVRFQNDQVDIEAGGVNVVKVEDDKFTINSANVGGFAFILYGDTTLNGDLTANKVTVLGETSLESSLKIGDLTWNVSTGSGALVQYRGSDGYTEMQLTSQVSDIRIFSIRDSTGVKTSINNSGKAYFAGKMGLGIASPNSNLDIVFSDPASSLNGIGVKNNHASGNASIQLENQQGRFGLSADYAGNGFSIYSTQYANYVFNVLGSNGYTGINYPVPLAPLTVGGEIWSASGIGVNNRFIVGESFSATEYGALGFHASSNYLFLDAEGTQDLRLQSGNEGSGNVVIGVGTANAKLDVRGSRSLKEREFEFLFPDQIIIGSSTTNYDFEFGASTKVPFRVKIEYAARDSSSTDNVYSAEHIISDILETNAFQSTVTRTHIIFDDNGNWSFSGSAVGSNNRIRIAMTNTGNGFRGSIKYTLLVQGTDTVVSV